MMATDRFFPGEAVEFKPKDKDANGFNYAGPSHGKCFLHKYIACVVCVVYKGCGGAMCVLYAQVESLLAVHASC